MLTDVLNCQQAVPTCFVAPIRSDEFDDIFRPFVPECTRSNNNWATKVFTSWVIARNKICPNEKLLEDLLQVQHPLEIQGKALVAFVLEARRMDGKPYPGTTQKNIVAALFRVMKQHQGAANVISFIDRGT